MFANDDIEFDPDFLLRAVDILGKRDGMLLPKIFAGNDKKPIESGIEADLRRLSFQVASSPEKINCLPTRGLFMRMWVVRHVGDFYPKLLPHYLSDYEYTIRANKKGIKLYTSNELLISFDKNTTGFHSFKNLPFINRMKNYFSKKSAANPVYWTIFILLASPSQHIPWQIIRVWLGAVKLILTSR
jgi:GT2 family glycosyltransferase